MNKRKFSPMTILLGIVAAAVCDAILLVLFNSTFNAITGQMLPWWAYIAATCIFALIVYLIYLLIRIHGQRFDRLLAREGFNADKRYEADGQTLCIDFEGKRIANTYLSTRTFVDFKDVVGCRVERYQRGAKTVLSEDECFVDLVITVNREDPTPDHPYLYIAMFEIKLAAKDVADTPDVTEDLVAEYPELQPMYELKRDITEILRINRSDAGQSAE